MHHARDGIVSIQANDTQDAIAEIRSAFAVTEHLLMVSPVEHQIVIQMHGRIIPANVVQTGNKTFDVSWTIVVTLAQLKFLRIQILLLARHRSGVTDLETVVEPVVAAQCRRERRKGYLPRALPRARVSSAPALVI